jgi:hypothetical protein
MTAQTVHSQGSALSTAYVVSHQPLEVRGAWSVRRRQQCLEQRKRGQALLQIHKSRTPVPFMAPPDRQSLRRAYIDTASRRADFTPNACLYVPYLYAQIYLYVKIRNVQQQPAL